MKTRKHFALSLMLSVICQLSLAADRVLHVTEKPTVDTFEQWIAAIKIDGYNLIKGAVSSPRCNRIIEIVVN